VQPPALARFDWPGRGERGLVVVLRLLLAQGSLGKLFVRSSFEAWCVYTHYLRRFEATIHRRFYYLIGLETV
jgi:hypothetical protein